MKAALFNLHDLILLWVLVASATLAALNGVTGRLRPFARRCLAAFFVLVGLIALDTLLFWGDYLRLVAFDVSPWLLTVFGFATFAAGPMLLWAVRAETDSRFAPRGAQWLHLLPALVTPLYLYLTIYRYPLASQRELILELGVYQLEGSYFASFVALKKLAPMVYGVLSLARLYPPHRQSARTTDAPMVLRYVAIGFTGIACWSLATHLCGLWLSSGSADAMGVLGNYLASGLLAWLIVICVRATIGELCSQAARAAGEPAGPQIDEQSVATAAQLIHASMESERPYLNPRLTLERFAAGLELPPRLVSTAINRCFQQHYQEYVNGYRLAEAKRLLTDAASGDLTMAEIAIRSGFNSRASFNRLFKSAFGTTPTDFRRHSSCQLATAVEC